MGLRDRVLRRASAPAAAAPGLPEGWVLPYWLDRRLDPSWPVTAPTSTPVGNLDSSLEATVDPRGLVTLPRGGWSLDWWVGADDRWHLPSREVAVRQRLVGDGPVVETAMRVPSGDVVHRGYAVRAGGDELVVVEIENRSPIPVALAIAVRPFGLDVSAGIEQIELTEQGVLVDGRLAVLLPKPPSRSAGSTAERGDVADAVLAGDAVADLAGVVCGSGMASAAFVFPLAHRTMLRFAMPLGHGARSRRTTLRPPTPPAQLPTSDQVANGWRVHGDRGARFVVPDERLQSAIDANRRFLLLRHDALDLPVRLAAAMAGTLDRQGFAREAAELLGACAAGQAGGGAFGEGWADTGRLLHAIGLHWSLHRDAEFVREHAPEIAQGAEWIERTRRRQRRGPDDVWGLRGFVAASELLVVAGETAGADDAARCASAFAADADVREPEHAAAPSLARLRALLDDATPTWTWADAGTMTEMIDLARGLLVTESTDGLALCSQTADDWLGRGIEVHDAPTASGRLSYAVRWHGDRPALLWELDAHPGHGPTVLRAPGLDPTWSSTEPRGDALLAPVAPPGTPVQLRRR